MVLGFICKGPSFSKNFLVYIKSKFSNRIFNKRKMYITSIWNKWYPGIEAPLLWQSLANRLNSHSHYMDYGDGAYLAAYNSNILAMSSAVLDSTGLARFALHTPTRRSEYRPVIVCMFPIIKKIRKKKRKKKREKANRSGVSGTAMHKSSTVDETVNVIRWQSVLFLTSRFFEEVKQMNAEKIHNEANNM